MSHDVRTPVNGIGMNEHLTKLLERDKLLHTLQKHRVKTV